MDEALDTARRAGVILNVSHMYPRPTRPPDEADVLIGKLEEARAGGLEVTFDLTMFPRGGGAWVRGCLVGPGTAATTRRWRSSAIGPDGPG